MLAHCFLQSYESAPRPPPPPRVREREKNMMYVLQDSEVQGQIIGKEKKWELALHFDTHEYMGGWGEINQFWAKFWDSFIQQLKIV